ncbi:MAG: glycosyltransferase family 39 protein [Pirellulaceae bacterium]|nr:glycosyltransferase family 39 protein [Pirellulaceae bacterium]
MKNALLLVAGLLLARLVYAAIVPLDLVHDEAYYWDWSRNLDYGYYSKPPMVAWLIAAGTALAGDTSFGVRLPAVLLGTCGLLWVYLLGRRMYDHQVGLWAMVVSAATPGNTALSLLMTIDAPLLFCWSASLYGFWRFLERGPDRRWWLLACLAFTGLGILSKQTMLGFLGLAGVFVLLSHDDRRELFRPGIWLWGLGSVAFLTPVLLWNWRHDWITLEHTSEHFATGGQPVAWWRHLADCGEFLATQVGVVSPLAWVLAIGVLGMAGWSFPRLPRRERFLLCFSGLPLAGVLLLSLRQRVEPNWPAAFYPAAIVLLVAWLRGHVALVQPACERPRLLRRVAVVGAVCSLLVYLMPFTLNALGLQGTRWDAAVRMRGWSELGQVVGEQLELLRAGESERPAVAGHEPLVLVTTGRAVASELAFYLPTQPRVYLWNGSGRVTSQYDIWGGPRSGDGADALIVTHPDGQPPAAVLEAFARVEPLETVRVEIGNGRRHEFRLWHGTALRTADLRPPTSTTQR